MNQPGLLLRVRFFGDDEGARLERGEEKEARENPRRETAQVQQFGEMKIFRHENRASREHPQARSPPASERLRNSTPPFDQINAPTCQKSDVLHQQETLEGRCPALGEGNRNRREE